MKDLDKAAEIWTICEEDANGDLLPHAGLHDSRDSALTAITSYIEGIYPDEESGEFHLVDTLKITETQRTEKWAESEWAPIHGSLWKLTQHK